MACSAEDLDVVPQRRLRPIVYGRPSRWARTMWKGPWRTRRCKWRLRLPSRVSTLAAALPKHQPQREEDKDVMTELAREFVAIEPLISPEPVLATQTE